MKIVRVLKTDLIQSVQSLADRLGIEPAHDHADELHLTAPGFLVFQGVVKSHGLGQIVG